MNNNNNNSDQIQNFSYDSLVPFWKKISHKILNHKEIFGNLPILFCFAKISFDKFYFWTRENFFEKVLKEGLNYVEKMF